MLYMLIADDEVIERTVLKKRLLKYYGEDCTVLTAENGREVLELYEAYRPQILILDIEMPGINGLEAARTIRKTDSDCSIIFLTAYDDFSYAKMAITVHALEYLLKPCDEQELVRVVDEAVRLSMSRRQVRQEYFSSDLANWDSPDDNRTESERHDEILAYIAQHYMEDIALQDIAGYLGYSEAYFCKMFKQHFGHGFVSFLTDYRLKKAEELIRTTCLSIKEIGKSVGYPDPNYFTKVFRRSRGVSPSRFRESASVVERERSRA